MKQGTQVFRIMQRLKKANIPVLSMKIEYRNDVGNSGKERKKWFAIFEADCWAVRKAQHPFDGCNPQFTLWDSKIRNKAKIAFLIN